MTEIGAKSGKKVPVQNLVLSFLQLSLLSLLFYKHLDVLLWPVRRHEDALSINCAINCTLLKAVPNVQQFLNFVNL